VVDCIEVSIRTKLFYGSGKVWGRRGRSKLRWAKYGMRLKELLNKVLNCSSTWRSPKKKEERRKRKPARCGVTGRDHAIISDEEANGSEEERSRKRKEKAQLIKTCVDLRAEK